MKNGFGYAIKDSGYAEEMQDPAFVKTLQQYTDAYKKLGTLVKDLAKSSGVAAVAQNGGTDYHEFDPVEYDWAAVKKDLIYNVDH